MDFKEELIKTIQIIVDNYLGNYKSDRTYRSIVKEITSKGYKILDDTGNERIVKCCIPNVNLKVGQSVWVKIPMGQLNNIYICGIV